MDNLTVMSLIYAAMYILISVNVFLINADEQNVKIIGGDIAREPIVYQVSLQYHMETDIYKHFCSGSILTSRHIVTAAHCLDPNGKKELISIVAGTLLWNSGGVRHHIAEIELHDQFKKYKGYDIGIITLNDSIQFNDKIQPIAFSDEYIKDDIPCILTGWGWTFPIRDPGFLPNWFYTITPLYPKELRIVLLKTVTNDECKYQYSFIKNINPTMATELCTYRFAHGACKSDSGGPLVNLERNKLIGIVSFGNNLCGGHTGYPDVFTRISNFTQWIQDRISTVE